MFIPVVLQVTVAWHSGVVFIVQSPSALSSQQLEGHLSTATKEFFFGQVGFNNKGIMQISEENFLKRPPSRFLVLFFLVTLIVSA